MPMLQWNFGAFLISKEGRVVERYAPTTSKASIEPAIIKELEK